jgi:hypothetical protein
VSAVLHGIYLRVRAGGEEPQAREMLEAALAGRDGLIDRDAPRQVTSEVQATRFRLLGMRYTPRVASGRAL